MIELKRKAEVENKKVARVLGQQQIIEPKRLGFKNSNTKNLQITFWFSKKTISGSFICTKQNFKLPKLKNHFKESNLTLIPWLHQYVNKEAGVH
jgi:uncharacterized protein (DUF362 family)